MVPESDLHHVIHRGQRAGMSRSGLDVEMLVSTRVESADQDTSVLADHSRMALGATAKTVG